MNGRWGGETAGHALDASARWATGVALPTVCCARRTDEPVVGLTLDDGPHPELTDAILDVLVKHEAQATFFLIGDRVVGNERVVRRIVDEGHEVGDHLMHDEPSIRLSRNRFREDLSEARDLLAPYQYSEQDRRAGYFFGKDRRGHLDRVPLMTLSIGVVTNLRRTLTSARQASQLATEMKTYAKSLPGSVYTVDRRSDERATPQELPAIREPRKIGENE